MLSCSLSFGSLIAVADEPAKPTVFRHDYARRGYIDGPAPVGLETVWSFKQPIHSFLSSPTVVGNRVYCTASFFDIGDSAGSIYCLDKATGKQLWEVSEVAGVEVKAVFSSPAITADGRTLVIGEGLHLDKNSRLICLDAATGRVRWHIRTPLHLEGSPAIFGDTVVAVAGAIEDNSPRRRPIGDPGFVFAASISKGEPLWRYDLADPETSPAISPEGIVYAGSGIHGNAVIALRSEPDNALQAMGQKRLVWRRATRFPVTTATSLVGDTIYVGSGTGDFIMPSERTDGEVLAINRHNGKVLWSRNVGAVVLGPIAVGEKHLYCPVRDGTVLAIARDDGNVVWRRRISVAAPVMAGPALAGEYVYAVSNDGYLAVLFADDGGTYEKHYLNDPDKPGELGMSVSSPTISRGRIFVGSETGGLRCFNGTQKD